MKKITSGSALKISTTISMGFSIIIVILAIISTISVYSVKKSLDGIEQIKELSQDSKEMTSLRSEQLLSSLYARDYFMDNSEKSLENYNESKNRMMSSINLAMSHKGAEENDTMLSLSEGLSKFTETFDEISKLIEDRNAAMDSFYKHGLDMRASLTNIMEYSYQTGNIDVVYLIGKMQERIMRARFYALDFIKTNSTDSQDQAYDEITVNLDQLIKQADKIITNSYNKDQLNNFKYSKESFLQTFNAISEAVESIELMNTYVMKKTDAQVMDSVAMINTDLNEKQNILDQKAYRQGKHLELITYSVSVTGVILSILFALLITRRVKKPLGGEPEEMAKIADNIAEGNLRIIAKNTKNPTGLYASMLKMGQNLTNIAENIREASETVSSGSEELASSSEQLSSNFFDQAQQVHSIASALEEMATSSEHVLDNIDIAMSKSDNASSMAAAGKEKLHATNKSIEAIRKSTGDLANTIENLTGSSAEISDILNVINDIADQTNLLALNAAIEAARAGDAGRGFAVVADEVRKLAERTQSAISEIDSIINSLQTESASASKNMTQAENEVEQGVQALQETEDVFNDIVSAVDEVVHSNNMIVTAVTQQNQAISSVNENIQAVSQGQAQSTEALKVITATINDLSDQAQNMKQTVEIFQT